MIIVKLWVHTSVKWKLSWGWESHCVVSISRDPNSSSLRPVCQTSVCFWGPNLSNNSSVPKSPTVQQYLMGRHINQVWLYFWINIKSRHQQKKYINTLVQLFFSWKRQNRQKRNIFSVKLCTYLDIFGGKFQILYVGGVGDIWMKNK